MAEIYRIWKTIARHRHGDRAVDLGPSNDALNDIT